MSVLGARMPSSGWVVISSTVSGSSIFAAALGGLGFGEVEAGDLEAVEEEAGAAGVDVVGGDAAEDFADGGLEGGAVVGVGDGEVEGGAAASAGSWVLCGLAGGVVVVAEVFAAEAEAAAAVAVGEDVAALVAFWFCLGHVCSLPHWVKSVQSIQKKRPESGLWLAS